MPDMTAIDRVLDKLARDVESSIHAFYRGDVRQHTQRVKSDTFVREARQALLPLLGASNGGTAQGSGWAAGSPASSVAAASSAVSSAASGAALTSDEIAAATRCVMAWLPMGPPTTAAPESRCVSAAREMSPTWGERENARLALKRLNA